MKLIIAGSRGITDESVINLAWVASGFPVPEEVVCGGAAGVDALGEHWAVHHSIPIKFFLPDWEGLGRAAGPIRNRQMAEYADALLAIWDGVSRGAKNVIEEMKKRDKKVYVHLAKEEEAADGSENP